MQESDTSTRHREEEGTSRSPPFRRTSRHIHYWILGVILVAVTVSFLFLGRWGPRSGSPAHAGWATSHPGHLLDWAMPSKGFVSSLIRPERASRAIRATERPIPRSRPRRRGREKTPAFRVGPVALSRRPDFASAPVVRWSRIAVSARASPILAWPSRPISARLPARTRTFRALLTRLHARTPATPEADTEGLLRLWSKRVSGRVAGSSFRQSAENRRWLRRMRHRSLSHAEPILPAPRHPTLMPGSVIPAVLLSEIDSDLPGMIVARVTRTVNDSIHEHVPVIPMGSTLVGYYSSDVSEGQTRILASFSEIIFPDGRRVPLKGMAAADAYGASGLSDEVHTHFWKIFGSSFLIAALSSFLPGDQSSVVLTPGISSGALVGSAAGQALIGTSQAILARNENIPPTLVIRPGFRFLVMVNRPIELSGGPG